MNISLRKTLKWVLLGAALSLVIGMGIIYNFRETIIAPHISRWISERIEEDLGLTVKIDRIKGTYFNGIIIENVTVINPAALYPLANLTLKHLELDYSLLTLFGGIENFLTNSRVDINQVDIVLDWRNPAGSLEKDGKQQISLPVGAPSAGWLPKINIEKSSLALHTKDGSSKFENIDIKTEKNEQDHVYVDISVARWWWRLRHLATGSAPVKMRLVYSQDMLEIDSFVIGENGFSASGDLLLHNLPQSLPFALRSLVAGAPIDLTGRIESHILSASFQTQGLDLEFITSGANFPEYKAAGNVSFAGDIHLPIADIKNMKGNLILNIKNSRFRGLETDSIHTKLSVDGWSVYVEQFNLVDTDNKFFITDVDLPDVLAFQPMDLKMLNKLSGHFKFDLKDIPSLVQLIGLDIKQLDAPVPEHRLKIEGLMEKGGEVFAKGDMSILSNFISLESSKFTLPAGNQSLYETKVDARVNAAFNDLRLLEKIFPIPPMDGQLNGDMVIHGAISSLRGHLSLKGESITIKDVALGDISIDMNGDGDYFHINELNLSNGDDVLTMSGGFFPGNRTIEEARLFLNVGEIKNYLALWTESPFLLGGDLQGEINLSGSLLDPEGQLKISSHGLQIGEFAISNAEIKASGADRKIHIEKAEANAMGGLCRLAGTVRLNENWKKLEIHLMELYLKRKEMDLGLKEPAHIQYTQPGNLTIEDLRLAGSAGEIQVNGRIDLKGSSDLSFELVNLNGREWLDEFIGQKINFERMNARGQMKGSFAAPEFDFRGSMDSLSSPYLLEPLKGQFEFSFSENRLNIEQFNWDGEGGSHVKLSGILPVSYADKTLPTEEEISVDASIQLPDLRLANLFLQREMISGGAVSANLRIRGTLADPDADLKGHVESLSSPYLPAPLQGEFDVTFSENRFNIGQFNWDGPEGSHVKLSGVLPVSYADKTLSAEETLSLDATIQLPDLRLVNLFLQNEMINGGAVSVNLQMRGSWQRPSVDLSFETKGLTLKPGFALLPPGPVDIESLIHHENGETSIQRLDLQSPTLSFNGKGQWNNGPTPATLYSSPKDILQGEIQFRGQAQASNLNWLASGIPALRRSEGRLDADFSIQGPVSKPNVSAKVHLRDGVLRTQEDLPPMEEIQLEAMVTPDRIEILEFKGLLGSSFVNLKGEIADILTGSPSVGLHIWGENLLLYRNQGIQVRADTDLNLQGPLQEMNLTGKVTLTEGRFNHYIDVFKGLQGGGTPETGKGVQLFSIRETPLSNMRFDVKILSKGHFLIRNNLIRGKMRPNLHLTGTGEVPVLRGEVFVDTARIRLPSGNLSFENGYVLFMDPDPDIPELNLLGTARMLGYDVTALIEGPYDDPIVTLSSSPPLSNEDLLLLLLTGTPPAKDGQAADKRARNLNVAVYLGRDLLSRWFTDEDSEDDESILDRFDAEVGRDITQKGEETLEASFRLARDVFREGDTLYLTGERDVFNFYNAGLRIVFRFK
ncbi:translocation/assembly module TamB domain-containing protein [Thermodesulfobacteriota bacterium]